MTMKDLMKGMRDALNPRYWLKLIKRGKKRFLIKEKVHY